MIGGKVGHFQKEKNIERQRQKEKEDRYIQNKRGHIQLREREERIEKHCEKKIVRKRMRRK